VSSSKWPALEVGAAQPLVSGARPTVEKCVPPDQGLEIKIDVHVENWTPDAMTDDSVGCVLVCIKLHHLSGEAGYYGMRRICQAEQTR
jgi:hypothetical protein